MTADSFELHSQHIRHVTVMGFSAGRPARCQDHMLYSGNRAERKQTALCFYYNPHTPNKCTCHPSTTRSVGQCCNSCHVVFYHFPNAAGSDESLFKNTSEWNIGVFKKMHELHPAPRFVPLRSWGMPRTQSYNEPKRVLWQSTTRGSASP